MTDEQLIEKIALALKGISDSMGVVRTWKDYAPAILPIITAEREAGRLEGARAGLEAAAELTAAAILWEAPRKQSAPLTPPKS